MKTNESGAGDAELAPVSDGADEERSEYARSIVQGFRLVFRTIQEHSRWVEKRCGVSAAQLWSLWEIHSNPGIRVSELSTALSIHRSTASNMLDKLVKKGLVRRERWGPDNRVVRLFLTEAGEQLINRAPGPAQGALSYALQNLPTEVLKELNGNLNDVTTHMQTSKEAALEPLPNSRDS